MTLPRECEEAREALDASGSAAHEHVSGCASCRAYVDEVERMDAALDAAAGPLDDVTRARVEARVLASLDAAPARAPSRRAAVVVWATAGVIAAAVAAGLALWLVGRATSGEPSGLVPVAVAGFVAPPELAAALPSGRITEVRAPAGGRVRLDDGRGVLLELEGPGELSAVGDGRVALASGRVQVEVAPGAGRRVVVEAGSTQVEVTGTRFFVARWAGEPVRVGVSRGAVAVRARTGTASVGPGRAWSADTGDGPAGLEPLAETERAALEAARMAPAAAGAGVLRLRAPGLEVMDEAGPVGTSPLVWSRAAGPAVLVLRGEGREARTVRVEVRAGETIELDAWAAGDAAGEDVEADAGLADAGLADAGLAAAARARAVDLRAPAPRDAGPARADDAAASSGEDTTASGLDPESLYQRAERAMADKDPVRAAGYLDTLIRLHPRDPLAPSALYERARLAYEAGDRKVARGALAALLEHPGRAPVAEPAHYLSCRVELDDGRIAAARTCLERFRASFPRSVHDRDALVALAQLAEREGGCAAARPWLEALVAWYPRDVAGQDAKARLERCPR